MNKYTVAVVNTGTTKRKLNGELHCYTGPAITWISGWTVWYVKGVFQSKGFKIRGEYFGS